VSKRFQEQIDGTDKQVYTDIGIKSLGVIIRLQRRYYTHFRVKRSHLPTKRHQQGPKMAPVSKSVENISAAVMKMIFLYNDHLHSACWSSAQKRLV